ncbi:MAG: hypothetical protein IJB30_03530, partial [Clostridia bacterium]|nr:hypothetical protein [Clostridia bacterium]
MEKINSVSLFYIADGMRKYGFIYTTRRPFNEISPYGERERQTQGMAILPLTCTVTAADSTFRLFRRKSYIRRVAGGIR